MSLTFNRLCEIISDMGLEPESYSGRRMYGAACVSLMTNQSVLSVSAQIVDACDDTVEAYNVLSEAVQDTLGKGYVIYWPHVMWEGEAPEE